MPLAGAALTGTMTSAIRHVHASKGPWSTEGGWEDNAVLIAATLALVEDQSGPAWALAAAVAGGGGALARGRGSGGPSPRPSSPNSRPPPGTSSSPSRSSPPRRRATKRRRPP